MQKLRAGDMCPTKERKVYVRAERTKQVSSKKEKRFLGTLSPDPWDLSPIMPIPVDD